MTVLVLDPAALSLFYPRASNVNPQKLRVIAQVVDYDDSSSMFSISRLPNLGPLHTEIDLVDEDEDEDEDVCEQYKESDLLVDVSHSAFTYMDIYDSVGKVISILGFYNGIIINAVECICLDEQALLGSVETLTAMATLENI